MNNLIGIVNYGLAGNIYSIKKAIKKAGSDSVIIESKDQIIDVDKIVLPGVGSFNDAMNKLNQRDLIQPLLNAVQTKPTLGICLGMQILSTIGFEYGKTNGLNILEAEVKPMQVDAKVPHMGFNSIEVVNPNKLISGLENEVFYFMHSYEVINYKDITALTTYAGHKFVSSVHKDNIYGVQFHPEKSREQGICLFKNFIEL